MRAGLFSISLLALTMLGCSEREAPVPEPASRPAKIITVSLSDQATIRNFPAVAEAGNQASLAFRVPGQMMGLDVRAGQMVEKGQVLARLNPDEYQQLLKQAKANFQLADVQFKRYKRLRGEKVVSEQDYDKAVANLNGAKADLEQAQARVGYTELKAPYDGTVSLIDIENYEYVNAQQRVMNIQTNGVLKVVFQLPEYLLRRFSQEQVARAEMVFDTAPERTFPLTFQEIDTEADSKTNSYKVTMVMERPSDVGLLPGMSGQVELEIPRGKASRLPDTALEIAGSESWVWRVNDDGRVSRARVTLDDDNHVLSGLNDGDRIVVSGLQSLEEGMIIREWVKERGL